MAVALAAVRAGLDSQSLKYHEIDASTIALGIVGDHSRLMVAVRLEENGEYLAMRTVGYATCPEGHPDFGKVMAELAAANDQYAVVSFGWDKSDGEITGEASLPLESNTKLTPSQVTTMFGLLVLACDLLFERLEPLLGRQERTSLETSKVPKRPVPRSPRPSEPALAQPGAVRAAQGGGARLLSLGVFLIGLAALGGVLWLFLHH